MEPLAYDIGRLLYSLFAGKDRRLSKNFRRAKAGDDSALRWLIERHEFGDAKATAALHDLGYFPSEHLRP